MAKHSSHILELAKRGAEVRFRELLSELKLLTMSFPHLRDAADGEDLPVDFILRRGRSRADKEPGQRRKMSAKSRAAISAAQKARWAKQKSGAK